ncbi:MAG: M20 family metallopeptidase [Salibacteraceae bacterium]|jgi:amidohydrolase|nr:M20 family metallopeptidase [Salibacteraceae bacterium]MDP4685452.1 M20 family metallopeptidase [Salibacteraceae bacterium]MDP4845480.1 M20 family metallopeptidase [Salibacteraceae bacterium]MDP4965826.1 M20 family metallopeptidase [Salibacteraceae bacterium]
MMIELIKQKSLEYFDEVLRLRRHLHQHPELSFEEFKTQALVKEQLSAKGIEVTSIANTGLVALIKGEKSVSEKVIALRGDMDALPITEENEIDYKSENLGVMHACGHDVHISSLLGTAFILHDLRAHFSGTIKLLFQPGEEKLPGGASIMIAEGALQNPSPTGIFGQHVYPDLEVGKLGFRSGQYMAACDEIYIEVIGKGGHGALPHKTIDAVLAASHIVIALQTITSRNRQPDMPSVLSIGKFIANGATNILPNSVHLEGTFRSFDEAWRTKAHQLIIDVAQNTAKAFGARAEVEVRKGYPFVYNDPELTQLARQCAVDYVGEENVVDLDLRMTGEDFAYYSQEMPGSFYRLGTRNEAEGIISALHTPTFNVDENSLKLSTGFMAYLALKELEK